jgi:hypothetical protein
MAWTARRPSSGPGFLDLRGLEHGRAVDARRFVVRSDLDVGAVTVGRGEQQFPRAFRLAHGEIELALQAHRRDTGEALPLMRGEVAFVELFAASASPLRSAGEARGG